MITAKNNNKAICGCFGVYPSFVAGILNSTKQIHFCVLCSEKLNYEYYVKKCIGNRESKITYKCDSEYFYTLSSQGDTIFIMFKERGISRTTTVRINIRSKCLEKNTVKLSNLRYSDS